MVLQNNSGCN